MITQDRLHLRIADIVMAFSYELSYDSFGFGENYRDFLCAGPADVHIRIIHDGLPSFKLPGKSKVFDSGSRWSLYRMDGRNIFTLGGGAAGSDIDRVAVFSPDFRRGEIHCIDRKSFSGRGDHASDPLEFPLSQLLMACLLARGRGLMVHACGVRDGGRGYLLPGNSTDGKTTLARLWRDDAVILNDDRIVLRRKEGRFRIYGTPWYGDYTGLSSAGAPLEKIFFLKKSNRNRARPRKGVTALSKLMARSFLPLWDKDGMDFSLGFASDVVESTPCHDLEFVPDKTAVDYARSVG